MSTDAPDGADTPGGADAPQVRLEVADGVAVVTLDRPVVLNAFSTRMGLELEAAYRDRHFKSDVENVPALQ